MENGIWIKQHAKIELDLPVAIVGSPGLRSIGKLAVDQLVADAKAELIAELYSVHMPSIYETRPSYSAHPALPGFGGIIVESGAFDFPKVQFYAAKNPSLIFVRGYHANFDGQYTVAQKVIEFLSQLGVKRMIVIAGYGSKEKKISCAATSPKLVEEMKELYQIEIGYKGPFMGFSGLVFGLSPRRDIEAVCLFAGTQPNEQDLELPDNEASARVVETVNRIVGFPT
jgi:proteasome assembly chaperone (PAC2) family protein